MRPTSQQQNAFLSGDELPGVSLRLNDAVRVVGGKYSGKEGAVVSLEGLGADPTYLVELDSGEDALIPQSFLKVVE